MERHRLRRNKRNSSIISPHIDGKALNSNLNSDESSNVNNNNVNNNNDNNFGVPLAFCLSDITYDELLQAYISCRKHKRWKHSAIKFELNLEDNLLKLYKDLITGKYKISKSDTFIILDPKYREIFAANFRDRIVHHLLIKRMVNSFEEYYSDSTYSCRKGRGTLTAALKLQQLMKEHPDMWVLGLDVSSFFPSINKQQLLQDILRFIDI